MRANDSSRAGVPAHHGGTRRQPDRIRPTRVGSDPRANVVSVQHRGRRLPEAAAERLLPARRRGAAAAPRERTLLAAQVGRRHHRLGGGARTAGGFCCSRAHRRGDRRCPRRARGGPCASDHLRHARHELRRRTAAGVRTAVARLRLERVQTLGMGHSAVDERIWPRASALCCRPGGASASAEYALRLPELRVARGVPIRGSGCPRRSAASTPATRLSLATRSPITK